MRALDKWDRYFMDIALRTAELSKDPSTQVGCVIAKDRRILSVGFNGFVSKMIDDPSRYENREYKLSRVIHAEMNAMLNALKHGVNISNSTMYITMCPCSDCIKHVIQAGISELVLFKKNQLTERENLYWLNFYANVMTDLNECDIKTVIMKEKT